MIRKFQKIIIISIYRFQIGITTSNLLIQNQKMQQQNSRISISQEQYLALKRDQHQKNRLQQQKDNNQKDSQEIWTWVCSIFNHVRLGQFSLALQVLRNQDQRALINDAARHQLQKIQQQIQSSIIYSTIPTANNSETQQDIGQEIKSKQTKNPPQVNKNNQSQKNKKFWIIFALCSIVVGFALTYFGFTNLLLGKVTVWLLKFVSQFVTEKVLQYALSITIVPVAYGTFILFQKGFSWIKKNIF